MKSYTQFDVSSPDGKTSLTFVIGRGCVAVGVTTQEQYDFAKKRLPEELTNGRRGMIFVAKHSSVRPPSIQEYEDLCHQHRIFVHPDTPGNLPKAIIDYVSRFNQMIESRVRLLDKPLDHP